MKSYTLLKIKYLALFLCLVTGFSACDVHIYDIGDEIIGRSWAGDVGMMSDRGPFGEPLYSVFQFDTDGFGSEYQYYQYDNAPYRSYRFRWYWENNYTHNLVLDYGNYGISYMDDVDVYGRYMTGIFFLDSHAEGFRFRLEMQ